MPTKAQRDAQLKRWRKEAPPDTTGEAEALPAPGASCTPEAPRPARQHRPPPQPDIRRSDRLDQPAGLQGQEAMRAHGWTR